jgi:hypothetical protein
VTLEAGVRQGSTLSPKLFALFVNDLLSCLKQSGFGCYIKGVNCNAVMFADDLLLLSISITHLQYLIDICVKVLGVCDLEINSKKSACLRIGPRHNITNCKLTLKDQPVVWKSDMKYLGVLIVSSKKFKCNLQINKQKFFRATNGIFGKIGTRASLNLLLSLIDTFCIPVLLYGLDAVTLMKSDRSTIDFVYSTVFCKLFHVKENNTIKLCQFFSGCLPPSYRLDIRRLNFFHGLNKSVLKDSLPSLLFLIADIEDYNSLVNNYSISDKDNIWKVKSKVFDCFKTDISM